MKISIFRFQFLLFIFTCFLSLTQGQVNWTIRNPIPTTADLNDITYGNGVYVAVGTRGTILTSNDGISWFNCQSDIIYDLFSVSWINKQFIVTGDVGTILLSTDGFIWSNVNIGLNIPCYKVIFANNQYFSILSDAGGYIYSSSDCRTWQKVYSTMLFTGLKSITWGNNIFITSNSSSGLSISTDGTKWVHDTIYKNFRNIVWHDSQFIAEGFWNNSDTIFTSIDGINWTYRAIDTLSCSTILFQNSNCVVFRFNSSTVFMSTSPDGINWTNSSASLGFEIKAPPTAVVWGGNQFVAVSQYGQIITSPDGITWTLRSSGMTKRLLAVTWGNNLFVAVGTAGFADSVFKKSAILTSPDAINWTLTSRTAKRLETFNDIEWASNQFVAVGSYGLIITSPDGIEWMEHQLDSTEYFESVAWNGNFLIAVGDNNFLSGIIYKSTTGSNWIKQNIDSVGSFQDVTWGNGLFVAVGNSGIMTSSNGESWTKRLPEANFCYSVSWSGSQFVVGGQKGAFFTSPDGSNWTKRQLLDTTVTFRSIIFHENQFVATISSYTKIGSRYFYRFPVLTSTDGVQWSTPYYNVQYGYSFITWGGGKYVGVADRGFIMTSVPDSKIKNLQNISSNNLDFKVFNGNVKFTVPFPSFTSLKLYNLQGRLISTFINCNKFAGTYNYRIQSKNLHGAYILSFVSGRINKEIKLFYVN